MRLAYVAEAFGCRPSDYHDADRPLTAHERFCIDEAALLVLSYAKRDAAEAAKSEAEDKGKGRGKGKKKERKSEAPAERVADAEGFAKLKEKAAAAMAKAQRKSMMG